MSATIFATGEPQDIATVLANKDHRVAQQDQLMSRFPQQTILASKLNIPGPVKNNAALEKIFAAGMADLRHRIPAGALRYEIWWHNPTGPEAFWVVNLEVSHSKQLGVAFETDFPLGRFFDVDALTAATRDKPLSRADMGMPERSCFVCGRPAKECARSRRHSVAELQAAIDRAYLQYFSEG
ncbi:citrate lyase holo-[acyl-carrier protein] synthase [Lacticaseibacillus chiayiensis]|uniref:citrate lyase holo-[acyl-carrier protein] synthase n=1 Tax=Lacticaseibacillus chiayiensis TaxID=2100821 RepID=UPI0010109661|nr:citrate lyase holo-[acyl-carrier protein] synthase [Lacticaseibacillus chiayiensis]RXT59182.1 citrate lyase holo-[acyl-carrier protein] synthase [Lacticaseibacillus chiayiensis]